VVAACVVWFVALPRHVMFYDVVEFVHSHKMSPALRRELPKLMAPPVNRMVHAEHIRILSQYRCETRQHFHFLRVRPHRPHACIWCGLLLHIIL